MFGGEIAQNSASAPCWGELIRVAKLLPGTLAIMANEAFFETVDRERFCANWPKWAGRKAPIWVGVHPILLAA